MIELFVCHSIYSKFPIQCLEIEFCSSSATFSKSRSTTLVSSKGRLQVAPHHILHRHIQLPTPAQNFEHIIQRFKDVYMNTLNIFAILF